MKTKHSINSLKKSENKPIIRISKIFVLLPNKSFTFYVRNPINFYKENNFEAHYIW